MTAHNKIAVAFLILAAAFNSNAAFGQQDMKLHQIRQVNALSYEPGNPGKFLVATYSGVYSVNADGSAIHIAPEAGGLTELIRNPQNPTTLLASGYRSKDEKLGVLRSGDSGKTWQPISTGGEALMAFHAMAYASADPSVVYGTSVEKQLHKSVDGGMNWKIVGETPDLVFDIAVSRNNPDRLFVATRAGLFSSDNGGKDWSSAYEQNDQIRPATMVLNAKDGSLWAYIYGYGLVTSADEKALSWQKTAAEFADRAVMTVAINPANASQMLAIIDTGAVLISTDMGKTWKSFEGHTYSSAERVATGRQLFEDNCVACHGEKGVGEFPDDMYKKDENAMVAAPALNDDAHAWHHGDQQLIATILNGSPRNERMLAWKDNGISRQNAESLVAYIKSLWSIRSLACQGQRHMTCMR